MRTWANFDAAGIVAAAADMYSLSRPITIEVFVSLSSCVILLPAAGSVAGSLSYSSSGMGFLTWQKKEIWDKSWISKVIGSLQE